MISWEKEAREANALRDNTKDAGRALAFGRNDKGQLGTGNTKSSTIPCVVKLPASVTGVVHAATGRSHSLVVTSDGKVFAAGENKNGQLGTGAGKEVTTWTLVPGLTDQKIVKVAAGVDFSLALSKDGQLWGWGSPQYGQLGNGSDEQHIAKANKIVYEPQVLFIPVNYTFLPKDSQSWHRPLNRLPHSRKLRLWICSADSIIPLPWMPRAQFTLGGMPSYLHLYGKLY